MRRVNLSQRRVQVFRSLRFWLFEAGEQIV